MNLRIFTPPPPRNRIIGHRGLAARAPENTLAGFQLAAKEGVDWIEFDIQLTKDHFLVIIHDDTLERTTNGKGLVYQHTLEELLKLDAGSWFSSSFKNERIPEFAACLAELLKMDMQVNIELKTPDSPPTGYLYYFALVFSQTLQSIWPRQQKAPLVSSFNWPLLEAVRTYMPSLPIGYLSETCTSDLIDEITTIHNAALHCNWQSLTSNHLEYAATLGLPILAYTVNDPKKAEELLAQNVFAVFSDDPTLLAKEIPSAP